MNGPSEDDLETIFGAYDGQRGVGKVVNGVFFYSVESHDREGCNVTIQGRIDVGDYRYEFLIDDGNWNGTNVRAWECVGFSDEVIESKQMVFEFER